MKNYRRVFSLCAAGLAIVALLVSLAPAVGQSQGDITHVAILSTASNNGEIAPCG
jgi:hypothetical protein